MYWEFISVGLSEDVKCHLARNMHLKCKVAYGIIYRLMSKILDSFVGEEEGEFRIFQTDIVI